MRKVIRLTPDDLGYKDRGKMKWQGLILSDMTEALMQVEKEEAQREPKAKPKMNEFEIGQVLQQAYLRKYPVAIQANALRNGHYYPDVECIVLGYKENRVYLKLKDGRKRSCTIEDIRNISFMNPGDWYEK